MPPKQIIGSRELTELPPIKKFNLRYKVKFRYDRPKRWLINGNPETGKSNLIENIGLRHDHILDIYGSKDNEGLCWIRKNSPIDDALLIHGDNTDLKCSWKTKKASNVTIEDIDNYEVVIAAHSFFSSSHNKFSAMEKITDRLYKRLEWRKGHIIFLAMRESNSVIYSRLSRGVGEKQAKADLLEFFREMRHFGTSVGADLIQWTGNDKSMREMGDYMIFKNVGEKGLPRDKWYLYHWVKPKVFRLMKKSEFVCLQRNGAIAWCTTGLVPFHKEEGVNLLKELDITIEHGEELIESSSIKIGDEEHLKIIKIYLENSSMEKTRNSFNPPKGLATISRHVGDHNGEILKNGRCSRCAKLDEALSKTLAQPHKQGEK